jgi:hypothetical protein
MNDNYFGYNQAEKTEIGFKGVPWTRKALVWIFERFWRGRFLWTAGVNDTCSVVCSCGLDTWRNELFIVGYSISWCPVCGRGYRVDFRIKTYPSWLRRIIG